ncbi:Protein LIN1 [Candida tropicalis]
MNDSDEEDLIVINDDEVLGKTRKQKQKLRNQVKLNYDSDSSDPEESDNEDVVKGKVTSQNDDEDDMFASDNEDKDMVGECRETNESKKTPQFLDVSQLEGQEKLVIESDVSDTDEDNDDEEVDHEYYNNTDDADIYTTRKRRAPKMEAFNLEEEANEGKFDLDGNYIRNDTNGEESAPANDDVWLNDYKRKDIKKARKAQEERKKLQTNKLLERNINMDPIDVLLSGLIDILEPDETPMEALARLNPTKKKSNKKKPRNQIDESNKELIQKVTDLCSTLINDKFLDDVYELTREELMRKYQVETGEAYKLKRGTKRAREEEDVDDEIDYGEKIWEFRWIGDDEINGPYSSYEMNHWKQSYFKNKVEVRKVGSGTEFKNVSYIEFT